MKGEKVYITTQGPKFDDSKNDCDEVIDTIPDFWRMVWDQKVSVVVMLTKIEENDEFVIEKCTQYWPKNVGETLDMEKACLALDWVEEEDMHKWDIKVRTFRLRRGDEERTVKQVHYLGWGDHKVPDSPDAFVEMSDKVNEFNSGSQGPLVVHCSAGVGRSGTFIGIHSYVKYMRDFWAEKKDLDDLNIPKLLISLRKDRPKMVQTKEQYEFIYKAILMEFERNYSKFIQSIEGKE